MIAIISPAKRLDFGKTDFSTYTRSSFEDNTWQLVKKLKSLTKSELKSLLSVSDNLTKLNYERFKEFSEAYNFNENAKQAILAYQGDVYVGFEASSLNKEQLDRAQERVRIISGLYGILRPYDLIQPYRLEMDNPLKIRQNKNLYEFWGSSLTENLNKELLKEDDPLLVNLASNPYYKAIDSEAIKAPILDITFNERKNGELKFISFNAKKARGMMARFIVAEDIRKKEHLQAFDYDGYVFSEENSSENSYFYIRE